MRDFIKHQLEIMSMAVVVLVMVIFIATIMGCSHTRGEQQELGAHEWLAHSDTMDAEYAQQIADELAAYKAAYKWRESWSQFWFEQYQRCAGADYLELKIDEDHQAEMLLEDANL